MKRYNIERNRSGFKLFNLFEDPKGEWVKYEDVKWVIEDEPPEIIIESEECNCAEMLKTLITLTGVVTPKSNPTWICPAHGYKKL